MQLQQTRDTAPEMAVRRLLHANGLRYRVDYPLLPGRRRRADIVFTAARVAVYVDGCFWHGCPEHGHTPKSNSSYWSTKISGNKLRDQQTNGLLAAAGWKVIRVWEHDDPALVAARIMRLVRASILGTR